MNYHRSLLLIPAVLFLVGLPIHPNARLAALGVKAIALAPAAGQARVTNGPELVRGVSIPGELAVGRKDTFSITAESSQLLTITIAPMDVDFVLRLYAPNKEKIAECGRRYFGPTPLSVVTNKAGIHHVEIELPANFDAPVRYEIKLEQQRAAIAQDQIRLAAEAAVREADNSRTKAEDLPKWENALSRWHEIGDRREEAYALTGIVSIYYYQSQYQLAFRRLGEAMTIWQSLNDPLGKAEALFLLSVTKYEAGQITAGINDCQAAMDLWRSSNSLSGQARGIVVQGVITKQIGDYQSAITLSGQARNIFAQLRSKRGETSALNSLAGAYLKIGYYQNAADVSRQALALAEQAGMTDLRRIAHGLLGESLLGQGEPKAALAEFNKKLALFEAGEDPRIKAYTFGNFGQTHAALKDWEKALEYYRQALELHRQLGNRQGEADTLNRMGWVMEKGGQLQAALDVYSQARPMSHDAGYRAVEISALHNLARVQRDLGQLKEAGENVGKAIDLIESTRKRSGGRGQRSSYLATMQEAYSLRIDLLMRQREQRLSAGSAEEATRLNLEALQASDQARARTLLESLAEAQAGLRKLIPEKILKREEDLQHRLNLMDEKRMGLFNGTSKVPEAERGQMAKAIDKELRALSAEYDQLQVEIRQAAPRYAELLQPPAVTGDQIKRLLDDKTVLLAYSLGDKRSYLWAVTRDSLESYTLPPRGQIEDKAQEVYRWLTEEERVGNKGTPQSALRSKQAEAKYWREASALGQMLLGPAAGLLGQKQQRRLLVVCEGAVQRLTFAALPEPQAERGGDGETERRGERLEGRAQANHPVTPSPHRPIALPSPVPLIANHEIVYLPSISMLAAINKDIDTRPSAPKTLALYADPISSKHDPRVAANQTVPNKMPAPQQKGDSDPVSEELKQVVREMGLLNVEFGFPRLEGTEFEAKYITSFIGPDSRLVVMNADANVESVMNADLTQYRIIHFATHGVVNNENPELSGLVLSLFDAQGRRQNGFLHMHEIYNLKLNADLIVLSSCESGSGKEVGGEGLMALTRGFFYAGAPRVVASLWKADDTATPILMREFYRQLIEKHASPAAALKEAQNVVRNRPQFQSPYYWAGFVLQGKYD
jgi:CHAT domain-containing protein/tetratricopeptide (TPR) repeat protein